MMFNIISNNCVAGRYYELCKQQFPNQFMWNLIKLSDFIKIIKNYDNIDFNNIQLLFTNNEMHKDHSNDKCSTIILNDINTKVYFIHHHYCEDHKSKKVNRINCNVEYEITGYDILTYIKNKWITRLRRNIKNNIKPIFVYCDTDSLKFIGPCDFEQINAGYRAESEKNGGAADDPKGKRHYLGVYEYEGEYADFMTWGAKKYIYREDSKLQTVLGTGDTWHITIAGVNKEEGAKELERRGGLDALKPDEFGRPHFVFRESGGVDAIYNDYPDQPPIRSGMHELQITRNLYLEEGEYTLGITDDFNRIILHPDLWRELLDARPAV